MKRYYLAYGSNLNIDRMSTRCPCAVAIGKAYLEGYRLLFKGSLGGSYLTIEKAEGYKVPVGVWSVNETDEVALDCYEGYPTFYYKTDIPITFEQLDGKSVSAIGFVYIMNEKRKIGLPSDYYFEVCMEGYDDFAFDKKYLEEAIEYTKEKR